MQNEPRQKPPATTSWLTIALAVVVLLISGGVFASRLIERNRQRALDQEDTGGHAEMYPNANLKGFWEDLAQVDAIARSIESECGTLAKSDSADTRAKVAKNLAELSFKVNKPDFATSYTKDLHKLLHDALSKAIAACMPKKGTESRMLGQAREALGKVKSESRQLRTEVPAQLM